MMYTENKHKERNICVMAIYLLSVLCFYVYELLHTLQSKISVSV